MGQSWVLSADLLAHSRFVVSPFTETVAAAMILSRPNPPGTPWIRSFRALHREAYLAMLAEDELRAVVAEHMWRPRRGQVPGWIADFLALPPLGNGATFADEFGQLAAWDDDRMRAEIGQFARGPLPAALGRPGLRDAVAARPRGRHPHPHQQAGKPRVGRGVRHPVAALFLARRRAAADQRVRAGGPGSVPGTGAGLRARAQLHRLGHA